MEPVAKVETRPSSIAPIKKEFLVKPKEKPVEEKPSEGTSQQENKDSSEPKPKKSKGGQNKNRKFHNLTDSYQLCKFIGIGEECNYGESCKYGHDIEQYLKEKPSDIGDQCILFDKLGKCPFGFSCRYLNAHYKDGKIVINEELYEKSKREGSEKNKLGKDFQEILRKKKFEFKKSKEAFELVKKENVENTSQKKEEEAIKNEEKQEEIQKEENQEEVNKEGNEKNNIENKELNTIQDRVDFNKISDDILIKDRPIEKKKLDFSGKLYLAPLTTVGNLPFRRVCKKFGADITCGEMALCYNLLQGQASEWALLRRHQDEDFFGVQICGNQVESMIKVAEIIENEIDCDFVDINSGCPIDLVYNQGSGSALLEKPNKLGQIIQGMSYVLNKPVTVKLRTGIKNSHLLAHKIIPKLSLSGAAAFTLHGRTKRQHYYDVADWNYIRQCSELVDVPFFGNGDILSYEDYQKNVENTSLSGAMIARGALMKPWIFTEIKERRVWDISSRERFDLLKDFCNFGLEHWGSDTQGVTKTRRFLLESLSFLHRYIPVGLLEVLPQHMNHRASPYFGRDELETKMASPFVHDWVDISEMLLGKCPPDFHFIPKHKASSTPTSEG